MATTLLEGEENAPGIDQHPGHEHPEDQLHPWAAEMYRRGFSFNGGERTKVFLGGPERFADVSDVSHADSPLDGRSLVAADFDDDGDVDLFVHNIQRERHHLYRNEINPGRGQFINVTLSSSRCEPIGATVRVRPKGSTGAVAQALQRGSGYASSQPGRLAFGVGMAESAALEVLWPGGALESFGTVAAGSRVLLEEGAGKAVPRGRAAQFDLAAPLPPGLKISRGTKIPPLTFEDSAGKLVVLDPEELTADGPVAIEIWASYCRPCVEKLPELARRHREGEAIIALSVDLPTERSKAQALLKASGAEFESLFMALEKDVDHRAFDQVVDLMRLPVPTTLVLEPGGVLGRVTTGRNGLTPDAGGAAGER